MKFGSLKLGMSCMILQVGSKCQLVGLLTTRDKIYVVKLLAVG